MWKAVIDDSSDLGFVRLELCVDLSTTDIASEGRPARGRRGTPPSMASREIRERRRRAGGWLAMLAFALASLPGCITYPNNFDNPNREEPFPGRRVSRWQVTDESAAVLAFGCYLTPPLNPPTIAAAPGQPLVYELEVRYVDKHPQSSTSDAFWCSDEELVSETSVSGVENLECFDFPARAVAVESWAPIVIGRVTDPGVPHLMPGTGYRMQLRIVGTGGFQFAPNGTCNVKGRVAFAVQTP